MDYVEVPIPIGSLSLDPTLRSILAVLTIWNNLKRQYMVKKIQFTTSKCFFIF